MLPWMGEVAFHYFTCVNLYASASDFLLVHVPWVFVVFAEEKGIFSRALFSSMSTPKFCIQ